MTLSDLILSVVYLLVIVTSTLLGIINLYFNFGEYQTGIILTSLLLFLVAIGTYIRYINFRKRITNEG
ncbi:hypothetical protein RI065_08450 [Mycoplasmatota bacterium zrk1]